MTPQPRQITAGELRSLLDAYPADAPVMVEGCDCSEVCIGVSFWSGRVHVRRLEGEDRYDDDYAELVVPQETA